MEVRTRKNPDYLFSLSHSEEEDCLRIYSPSGNILAAEENGEISLLDLQPETTSKSYCWNLFKWENKYCCISKYFQSECIFPMLDSMLWSLQPTLTGSGDHPSCSFSHLFSTSTLKTLLIVIDKVVVKIQVLVKLNLLFFT